MDCNWSVVEYNDDDRGFPAEVTADIPVLPRKRCNTMPGSFVIPDDTSQDHCQIDDGQLLSVIC